MKRGIGGSTAGKSNCDEDRYYRKNVKQVVGSGKKVRKLQLIEKKDMCGRWGGVRRVMRRRQDREGNERR